MLITRGAAASFDKVAAQCQNSRRLDRPRRSSASSAPTCRRGFFARGSSAAASEASGDFRLA